MPSNQKDPSYSAVFVGHNHQVTGFHRSPSLPVEQGEGSAINYQELIKVQPTL